MARRNTDNTVNDVLGNEPTLMQLIETASDLEKKKAVELSNFKNDLEMRASQEMERLGIIREEERAAYRQVLEKKYAKEAARLQRQLDQEIISAYFKSKDEKEKKAYKEALKREKEKEKQDARDQWDKEGGGLGNIAKNFSELTGEVKLGFKRTLAKEGSDQVVRTLKAIGKAIGEGLNQINQSISKYAQYQTAINTRLQGTEKDFAKVSKTLNSVAFSPLVKAESLYENINKFVEEGISYNLEQRAFLETIKSGIATTFEADNQTLRRLIRIQQQDSTAARLGMESYLTQFLNEFVKTTEYLTTTFDTVADHLLEASAMLGSADASAEFEYVVQKWLGALTGIGLSDNTASAIAQAIGEIGSGDISNIGAGGIQSLMIMAAARSSLDYAKLLNSGLDALDTNKLMLAVVNYMQEIGSSSSNVVKNQLAKTFGVSVSDLVAVSKNLDSKNLAALYNSMMSYGNMQSELAEELKSLPQRMGIANILENLMSNITFQTGMNIASNPATFAAWKISDLITSVTGGINIPFVTALGSGIDLNATVEQLVKLGIVGVSFFKNIGNIISGVNSVKDGSTLLEALNIGYNYGLELNKRGEGLSQYTIENSGVKKLISGTTTSASTYIGNVEGSAYSEEAVEESKRAANQELESKKEEDPTNIIGYLTSTVQLASRLEAIEKYLKDMDEGITIRTVTSTPKGFTTDNKVGME